jgi:hypothetical protein
MVAAEMSESKARRRKRRRSDGCPHSPEAATSTDT